MHCFKNTSVPTNYQGKLKSLISHPITIQCIFLAFGKIVLFKPLFSINIINGAISPKL